MDVGKNQSLISDNSRTAVPKSLLKIVDEIVIKRAMEGEKGIQESEVEIIA